MACSLDAERFADRRREWEQLCRSALIGLEPTASGIEACFRQGSDIDAELSRLVTLERSCCSFASWTVRTRESRLMLTVNGSPDAVATLHALFAAWPAGQDELK